MSVWCDVETRRVLQGSVARRISTAVRAVAAADMVAVWGRRGGSAADAGRVAGRVCARVQPGTRRGGIGAVQAGDLVADAAREDGADEPGGAPVRDPGCAHGVRVARVRDAGERADGGERRGIWPAREGERHRCSGALAELAQKLAHEQSDYVAFQGLSQHLARMILSHPRVGVEMLMVGGAHGVGSDADGLQTVLVSYRGLFVERCTGCERVLSAEGHVPPVARIWEGGNGEGGRWEARHATCV